MTPRPRGARLHWWMIWFNTQWLSDSRRSSLVGTRGTASPHSGNSDHATRRPRTQAHDPLEMRGGPVSATGVVTWYLHDGDHLAAELSVFGDPVNLYSYYPGVDAPHAMRRGSIGSTYYHARDAEGDVTGLFDGAGTLVNTYAYAPFGQAESTSEQVPNALRFKGREYDLETGLYYMRARYHDAHTGRFVSEDTIGLAGGSIRTHLPGMTLSITRIRLVSALKGRMKSSSTRGMSKGTG